MNQLMSRNEALRTARQLLEKLASDPSANFYIGVWTHDADHKLVRMDRVTWQFPTTSSRPPGR
jgi:hypothetical protein